MRSRPVVLFALVGLVACGDGRRAAAPTAPAPPPTVDAPTGRPVEAAPLVVPGLRLPRTFAVERYAATLTIDPAQPTMAGEIEIAGALAAPQAVIWLHAVDLTIEAAVAKTAGGEVPLEAVTGLAPGRLALRASAPLSAGRLVIALRYRARLEAVDTVGTFRQQVGADWYAFTQHESIYARRSFPCVDEPDVKVPWTLTLVVPAALTAVANAPAVTDRVEGAQRRVEFAPTPPLPSYLIAYAVGRFDVVPAGTSAGGAPIRIIALAGRGGEAAFAAAATPKLLAELERWFGTPYPYAKLDSIAIPATVGFGAMENPGLITYRESALLLPPDASVLRKRRYTGTAAHELAHMWFGDLVTPAWWDDIWLNESFASWLPGKIVGRVFPEWDKPDELVEATGAALRSDSLATARRIRQPIETEDDILTSFDGITYGKGAAVLRMFEQQVGADAFQRGVRAYLAKHAHGNATAADFLAAIAAAAPGQDVVAAFGTFLDQAGAPRIDAAVTCGATTTIRLAQRRYLPLGAGDDGAAHLWRVPVCVKTGTAAAATATTCTQLVTPDATIEVAGCPTWVWPNADGGGYYRAALTDAQWQALVDVGWARLTSRERLAAAGDLAAAIEAGDLGVDVGLRLVPKLVAQGGRPFVAIAVDLVNAVRPSVPAAAQPKFARWVKRTFGAAAKVGLLPRATDDVDVERVRADVVPLVADAGGDPALRKQAVALAARWRTVPESGRGQVLWIAVRAAPALHEGLLAEFRAETDRTVRTDLARALGAVADPARLEAALALMLDETVDIRDSTTILQVAQSREDTQPIATAFAVANLDALIARVPGQSAAGLVGALAAGCDAATAPAMRALADAKLGAKPGAKRRIDQAFERLAQCAAKRVAIQPALDAWLATLK